MGRSRSRTPRSQGRADRTGELVRWLVRFGYDGEGFDGWARQPGRPTIEGAIRSALQASGAVTSVDSTELEVASRTDAGVSARANALALRLGLPGPAVLRILSGCAPEIFCTAARPIPEEFRVRAAAWREYRYFIPGTPARAARLRRVAARFPRTVDVRTFGRGFPPDRPTWRTIDRLSVRHDGRGVRIDVRARGFVWGMVRKLVGGLLACEQGQLSITDLLAAARGSQRRTLGMAPAPGLLLWEVHYPGRWTIYPAARPNRSAGEVEALRRRAETRVRLLTTLERDVTRRAGAT